MAVVASSQNVGLWRYRAGLVAFFAFFSLLLFTVVEMRRAFLFPLSDYLKVGAPSTLLYFDLRHLPLLLVGGLGTWLAYEYMARLERGLKQRGVDLKSPTKVLAVAIGAFLVIDLFIYRGVPASRIAAAGKLGVGQAIPLASFPGWLQPLGEGVNYLALVWHATFLGMLLGGLFLVVAGTGLLARLKGKGFGSHIAGVAMALPHPFCSCCAAPIGSALYRGGASLGPVLAFTVSSPMLNVTSLILATALLPTYFALLRVVGGIVVGVFLTYGAALIAARWVMREEAEARLGKLFALSSRVLGAYSRLFNFESFLQEKAIDSPVALVSTWLTMAWRLARVVVPVLFVGAVAAAAIVKALPSTSNDMVGVVVAAAFGTMFMIPTWTEIAIAGPLIKEGLTGPAAAMLLTLPAVSIPCLVIIGGAIGNYRVALLLGFLVFLVGTLAGYLFL